jgi:hypothetical protein
MANLSVATNTSLSDTVGNPVGEVVNSVFSKLDSTEDASSTADVVAETAQSLSNAGVVETDVAGVALVTSLLGDNKTSSLSTATSVQSLPTDASLSHQTSQPSSQTGSDFAGSITEFDADEKSSVPNSVSNSEATVIETISSAIDSDADSFATSEAGTETFSATFLQALLFVLRAEQLDKNLIRNITNEAKILNKENTATVVNND